MTTPNHRPSPTRPTAGLVAAALLCAAPWTDAARAATPRTPKPASSPSTSQILAPSRATVPDALPTGAPVWRCGNSYSERPCAQTGAAPLDVADPRTDAQRRQSEDVAARDQRLAAWFEAGRRERDTVASAPAGRRLVVTAPCAASRPASCTPRKPPSRRVVTKAAADKAK